jgi:hypothetical protein
MCTKFLFEYVNMCTERHQARVPDFATKSVARACALNKPDQSSSPRINRLHSKLVNAVANPGIARRVHPAAKLSDANAALQQHSKNTHYRPLLRRARAPEQAPCKDFRRQARQARHVETEARSGNAGNETVGEHNRGWCG